MGSGRERGGKRKVIGSGREWVQESRVVVMWIHRAERERGRELERGRGRAYRCEREVDKARKDKGREGNRGREVDR